MKSVWIGPRYLANVESLVSILRGDKMADVIEAAGEQIAERARQLAPVDTGSYRDAMTVVVDRHPTRVAAHVGSPVSHGLGVENRSHVMRRALG